MPDLRVARNKVRILRSHQTEDPASTLPQEELLASVWELTEEIYSLAGHYDAQSRLQRNVAFLIEMKFEFILVGAYALQLIQSG